MLKLGPTEILQFILPYCLVCESRYIFLGHTIYKIILPRSRTTIKPCTMAHVASRQAIVSVSVYLRIASVSHRAGRRSDGL